VYQAILAQGLGGHSIQHETVLWWVVLGLFALVVVCMLAFYKYSRSQVELEDADAILEDADAWLASESERRPASSRPGM
jgi:hypothetical protein